MKQFIFVTLLISIGLSATAQVESQNSASSDVVYTEANHELFMQNLEAFNRQVFEKMLIGSPACISDSMISEIRPKLMEVGAAQLNVTIIALRIVRCLVNKGGIFSRIRPAPTWDKIILPFGEFLYTARTAKDVVDYLHSVAIPAGGKNPFYDYKAAAEGRPQPPAPTN